MQATNIDPTSVESAVLSMYEGIAQTTLYPGDPVRLFLEGLAYVIATQNNVIDLAGRTRFYDPRRAGNCDTSPYDHMYMLYHHLPKEIM